MPGIARIGNLKSWYHSRFHSGIIFLYRITQNYTVKGADLTLYSVSPFYNAHIINNLTAKIL